MGQVESSPKKKKYVFGSYKNTENPRPGYHKTKSVIYYRGNEMSGVDLVTFKKLKFGWARDNTRVYYAGERVSGIDVKTFRMENDKSIGVDKNGKWFKGKRI